MVRIQSLVLTLALALLASCRDDAQLSERLETLAASHVGQSIDISIAAPFAWDQIAVFGAYYPKQTACEELRLSAWACFWMTYPEPDDASPSLIVFLSKGGVAGAALLPRCKIEVALRGRVKADRGTGRFLSSTSEARCHHVGYRLTQE
jgi:hypothetical protein